MNKVKKVRVSKFFEWYFSDENSGGISITHWKRINEELYSKLNRIFISCGVIPKRLVEGEEGENGDYHITEVVLVKDLPKFKYQLTTNIIWGSFDNGVVEAETIEEATKLAMDEICYNFEKINEALTNYKPTLGFEIDMDVSQIEVKEI
jgi:hypothetical protein